ncbi:MAG: aminoglycoside 6'-N-acetyltransferase [Lachnospiraceae bacterium]|nr:aminoglycoside 6'-N-acetyltransferase [Lachnospiraceae bacterium]
MVRIATNNDSHILAEMAIKMWDNHTVDELETEFMKTLNDKHSAFFIKYINNIPVGFSKCGLRTDYVEGTKSSPVGYLEGIFVKEKYRKKGYAKELLCACEMWAKEIGCIEFASDCELDNIGSFKFHMAMGFDEANRIICFKKNL